MLSEEELDRRVGELRRIYEEKGDSGEDSPEAQALLSGLSREEVIALRDRILQNFEIPDGSFEAYQKIHDAYDAIEGKPQQYLELPDGTLELLNAFIKRELAVGALKTLNISAKDLMFGIMVGMAIGKGLYDGEA